MCRAFKKNAETGSDGIIEFTKESDSIGCFRGIGAAVTGDDRRGFADHASVQWPVSPGEMDQSFVCLIICFSDLGFTIRRFPENPSDPQL
jgi:hypothetical protein